MADDTTKDALGTAATWLGGTGALAAFGVFVRGVLSGASGQEKEVREALQQENARLRRRAQAAMEWQDLCLKARREAEKLGYDASRWPPDPGEGDNP